MATKQLTLSEIAEHATKKDLWVIIHDKVYNSSVFIDEHPGGEEVLLDVAGQDATEAFEDVGHSDEARDILETLRVGDVKRQAGDPEAKDVPINSMGATFEPQPPANASTGLGVGVYAMILVGGAVAYLAYQYLQGEQNKS